MNYTRLFSDSDGESHFETLEMSFSSVDFAPPAPPLEIMDIGSAEKCTIIKAAPGWYGDWHPAPYRQIHFYLSGEVEAEASDGDILKISAGDIVLVEDISGKGHRSRVIGSSEVVIAAVKLFE